MSAKTIQYGWCPGCNALHRMTDCPDNRPAESEFCVCCVAIVADSMRRALDAKRGRTAKP